jgi:hypothetical protein
MGDGLGNFIAFFGLVCVAVTLGAVGLHDWLKDDAIRSDSPIEPRIELVVRDNQVDTIYVYELKK